MARILIKNGKIFDGNSLVCKDLFAENGEITKIEPRIDDDCDFVFDAKDKLVLPGLIDVHIHMQGHSSDAFSFSPELATLPFGVTSACDAGSSLGDDDALDAISLKSVNYILYRENHGKNDELLEKYKRHVKGIKVYFDTAESRGVRKEDLIRACEYARQRELSVMVHTSNSPIPMAEIAEILSAGDIITHTYHGGVHTAEENDFEAFKIAKERGVLMDAGFAGHIHTDFGVLTRSFAAGFIPDTISTDITKLSAYTRGGRYGMTMCMSIAREAGMNEIDIFKAVTENPAKALGKKNEWGALKVGRKADIAVLDYLDESFVLTDKAGNVIKNQKGYKCLLTVLDGQVIYRH